MLRPLQFKVYSLIKEYWALWVVREQAIDRLGLLAEIQVRDLDLNSMSPTDRSSRNASRDIP